MKRCDLIKDALFWFSEGDKTAVLTNNCDGFSNENKYFQTNL